MINRRIKPKMKKCPRCGLKMPEQALSCEDCGLKFERLNLATNKDAKQKKLRGDRSFIIKTSKLPSDVSYLKLLLYSIFLGIFGGHCYYVGRYLRGVLFTLNFIALLSFVVFNSFFLSIWQGVFFEIVMPICGAILFVWFYDIFMIAIKRFKVPVAIDLKEGEV